jgi:hypothetical protein
MYTLDLYCLYKGRSRVLIIIQSRIQKLSVAIPYTIVILCTRYPLTMNNKNKQDVGYYSSEARTWVNCVCRLRPGTSDLVMNPTEGSDGISLRQLARQARATLVGDLTRCRESKEACNFLPCQNFTFGSFELAVDGSGRLFEVSPPPFIDYMRFGRIESVHDEQREAVGTYPGPNHLAWRCKQSAA